MPSLYNNLKNGEVEGSATAVQMSSIECSVVTLKADPANTGYIWFGGTGVTAQDGTADVTTGFPLAAGEQLTLFVKNLNEIFYICDSADDDFFYVASG
jgi:hypothetical protein